jgi:hypothetical protein
VGWRGRHDGASGARQRPWWAWGRAVNVPLLRDVLREMGVSDDAYDLDGRGGTEGYRLVHSWGRWSVFYADHGQRKAEGAYDTEGEACDDLRARDGGLAHAPYAKPTLAQRARASSRYVQPAATSSQECAASDQAHD